MEKKTLILHGLYCPPLNYNEAFRLIGTLNYSNRQDAIRSLENIGLVQSTSLTESGWKALADILDTDSAILASATEVWRDKLEKLQQEQSQDATRWATVRYYVPNPFKPPEPAHIKIEAPFEVADACRNHLEKARLCICVGAWAGAIAYCSLSVEHLLLSVMIIRGKIKESDEPPPTLQVLIGEVGKLVPEIGSRTKRLVPLIANFRNDSVHPRNPQLQPGENQARNVFDLTARFMSDVRQEWFTTAT